MSACAKCSGPLPIQTGRGRRRTKCEKCSPPRKPAAPSRVVALPAGGESLVEATTAELEACGMGGSALGQAAIILARRIDAGQDNGSAMASMVKQWQDTLGRATAGAEPAAVSTLDMLKARRDARRHA